jgi:hypothetical protein
MRNDSIFIVHIKGSRRPRAFGSIEAIFDAYTPEEIGSPKYKLWGAFKDSPEVKTSKVTIHKVIVERRRQKR